MSNMIPESTVLALRSSLDISIGAVGVSVKLFVPLNSTALEGLEAFRTTEDRTYKEYQTKAFICWNPDQVMLRKLNIYAEDELPIVCYLDATTAKNVEIDSYIEIPVEVIPKTIQVNKFDIVNKKIPHTHDKVIFSTFLLVPRRT